jgi:hypothetical protein
MLQSSSYLFRMKLGTNKFCLNKEYYVKKTLTMLESSLTVLKLNRPNRDILTRRLYGSCQKGTKLGSCQKELTYVYSY